MKLFGIDFKFNFLFLLVLFLFALSGLFVKAALTFIVVLSHELAHAMMAHKLGVLAYEIELLPFGGVVKFNDLLEIEPDAEKMIAAAGPIFNFFLAAVVLLLLRYQVIARELAFYLLRLNLSLGLFNLIPAFPLDGGRILRANLIKRNGLTKAHKQVLLISKIIAIFLALVSIAGLYFGYANISLLIIAFFIYFIAIRSRYSANYAVMQAVVKKKDKIKTKKVVKVKTLLALDEALIKDVLKLLAPNYFHTIYVIDSNFNNLGLVNEDQLIKFLLEEGINFTLKEIINSERDNSQRF